MTKIKIAALILALLMVVGCSASTTSYSLATGGTSGTYYSFGGSIANLWNKHVENTNTTAEATGASKENLRLIASGASDLAIVQNDVFSYALSGIELFDGEKIEGVSSIAILYPEIIQLVVRADSDIFSVADLRGKTVSVGASGSGTEANARQILAAYELSYDDITVNYLSFGESSDGLKNKQIDAAFITAGIPNAAIVELSASAPVRLISLDAEAIASLKTDYPFYTETVIPKDVYSTEQDCTTIAIMAMLVCRSDMTEDEVYNLTSALFENLPELGAAHAKGLEVTLAGALSGLTGELHPGAAKYYAEKGIN